jgi:chromosomal replication initiation ATPase DnaA
VTYILPEPTTAAEVMERARASHARQFGARPSVSTVLANRVLALRHAEQTAISDQMRLACEQAHELCDQTPTRIGAPDHVKVIIRDVALATGVTVAEILGRRRSKHIVLARKEAMQKVANATGYSLPRIGQIFGGRDHTTVLYCLHGKHSRRCARVERMRAWVPSAEAAE